MATVACVLYQGEDVPEHSKNIFTPEWVDRLYRGVRRNTTREIRFVCYTDRQYEFKEPIEQKSFKLPYRNMFSLLEPFGEDTGKTVFMGLDTVITGNIDFLWDLEGFHMLQDPYFPERDCSGVMVFEHMPALWAEITAKHSELAQQHTMFGFPSDMIFLDGVPHKTLVGTDCGIYSYKVHIRDRGVPIEKARIVYFHGQEKPHELPGVGWVDQHWGEPVVPQISFVNTLNNDLSAMVAQFQGNLRRYLPRFEEEKAHDREMLLVGGGPSLAETIGDLRARWRGGGVVYALNGTHDHLIAHGIIPKYHVILDSRMENVEFVRHPRDDVTYLINAFCHPAVFDALAGKRVVMWLSDADEIRPLVSRYDKPLVGGGATVAMKSLFLGFLSGFRRFHLYGMDSCYRGDRNHAYPQPMNDGEPVREIMAAGRKFICAPWMAKQAQEFQWEARMLFSLGCEITVHGDGLISWIAKQWAANQTPGSAA